MTRANRYQLRIKGLPAQQGGREKGERDKEREEKENERQKGRREKWTVTVKDREITADERLEGAR